MARKKQSNEVICRCKEGSVFARNAAAGTDCTCDITEAFSGKKSEIKNVEIAIVTGKFPKVSFVSKK